MASIRFQEQVSIPLGLVNLDEFRSWCASDESPERGRIDYLCGDIEVDMSPEDFFTHGTLKCEIVGALRVILKQNDLGHLVTDSTRVSNAEADISVEPDIVFLSHDALDTGRARLVPKAGGEADRFIEIEGAPDLIVEIVSDSSFRKDTERLPAAYFQAGVSEYWLVDARRDQLVFQLHVRGMSGFEPTTQDDEGYQFSGVFDQAFRLDRRRSARGHWQYLLEQRS